MDEFHRNRGGPPLNNGSLDLEGAMLLAELRETLGGELPLNTRIFVVPPVSGDCQRVVTDALLNSYVGGQFKIQSDDGTWSVGKIAAIERVEVPHGGASAQMDLHWLAEGGKNIPTEVFRDGPFRQSLALKLHDEPAERADGTLILTSKIMVHTASFCRAGREFIAEAELFGTAE